MAQSRVADPEKCLSASWGQELPANHSPPPSNAMHWRVTCCGARRWRGERHRVSRSQRTQDSGRWQEV